MSCSTRVLEIGHTPTAAAQGGAGFRIPARQWRSVGPMTALLLGLIAGPSVSDVFYVDNSNPTSTDFGAGTSDRPYRTISAALSAHHDPGTSIQVMPGLYREQITVPTSGLAWNPILLQAAGTAGHPVV